MRLTNGRIRGRLLATVLGLSLGISGSLLVFAVTGSPSNFESADGNMTLEASNNTDWNCFVGGGFVTVTPRPVVRSPPVLPRSLQIWVLQLVRSNGSAGRSSTLCAQRSTLGTTRPRTSSPTLLSSPTRFPTETRSSTAQRSAAPPTATPVALSSSTRLLAMAQPRRAVGRQATGSSPTTS